MNIDYKSLNQNQKTQQITTRILYSLGVFGACCIVFLFFFVRHIHINTVLQFPPHLNNLKPRILILSLNCGMGHKVASGEMKSKLSDQYNVDILDQDMHDIPKAFNMYNALSSSYFGKLVLFVEKLPIFNQISNTMKSITLKYCFFDKLCDHLSRHDFKAVLAVAPFYGQLMQDIYSKCNIPCFTIFTDARGSIDEWLCNNQSIIITPSKETYDFISKDQSKHLVSYCPIRSEFFDDRKSKIARRDELGLDRNKKTILVCFGGAGSTESIDIIEQVKYSEHQYVFVCGSNSNLKNELEQLAQGNHNTIIKGLTPDMHRWMQAADVFIGKPGPGVLGECMASKLYIITSSADVMAQEKANLDMVDQFKIGKVLNNFNNILPAIEEIVSMDQSCPQILTKNPTDEALEIILDLLHNPINHFTSYTSTK